MNKEQWKEIIFNIAGMHSRYAVSDAGRIASFKTGFEEKNILSGTLNNGYLSLKIKPAGKDIQLMVHRLVAQAFLKKTGKNKKYVIHLNYKKTDNRSANLKWAAKEEMEKHQQQSPHVIASRKARRSIGFKLTTDKVIRIKKEFKNENISIKSIAKKFNVSEMQIYRIKRKENWKHVKI